MRHIIKRFFLIIILFQLFGIAFHYNKIEDNNNLEFGDFSFKLEVYVWRNFMPGTNDSHMISINKLIEINENDIASRFELLYQEVIQGNSVWEAIYTDQTFEQPSHIIERISREGPLWKPGSFVDVTCHYRDITTGLEYEITVEDQIIHNPS